MIKKILWIVPARSGSKSIPDKNIKILGGHPLLSYRIRSGLSIKYSCDLWLSTDSDYYAEIGSNYKAEVPFRRPAHLSTDDALSSDVVLHAMSFAKLNDRQYEYIGLLEPTSPFVSSIDLENAIERLENTNYATATVAVKESRPNKIFTQEDREFLEELAQKLTELKRLDRQYFKKEITPSGGFYISKWDNFLTEKTFYTKKTLGYELGNIASLEIDEPIDWLFAEFIIQQNLFDPQKVF